MLFENPNAIYLDSYHSTVEWQQVRTLAFSYYSGIMFVGSVRATHVSMYKTCGLKDDLAESREGRGRYAGRLYMSPKIITFWDFPETNEILRQVLTDIEEETDIRFDNSWKVEVPLHWIKDKDKPADWGTWHPKQSSQKFVPIDQYTGGYVRSEEEMNQKHILSPIEKEKIKKQQPIAKGFGSDKTAWDSENNIKKRQLKFTSESMKK
jgi:hypothetical protein